MFEANIKNGFDGQVRGARLPLGGARPLQICNQFTLFARIQQIIELESEPFLALGRLELSVS